MSATKHDQEKIRMELISTVARVAEALVLTDGAKKYGANNWRKGMEWTRLIGAALRHITAWQNEEDLDPETGLSHLAHARCCLGFLLEYQAKGLGEDDRAG